MGILLSLFEKKSKVSSHDRAVLDLKVQRDKLKQYQLKVNTVIEKETEAVKELMKVGKKKQAMGKGRSHLTSQKYQENLLEKSIQQLENIQQMVDSVEFTVMEQKVFESLKEGNKVLNAIHSEMSIENVEQLMQETEDAIAYQNEIDNLLAGQFSSQDEDDIQEQLEALEREVSGVDKLPTVPVHTVVTTPPAAATEDVDIEIQEEPASSFKTKNKERVLVEG